MPDANKRRLLGRHFSMLRSFHLADLFTLANAGSGTAAIFLSMAHLERRDETLVVAAGALVALALAFDVLDGRVARWRHRASPLGRELDSLADVISFGVAPAAMAYAVGLDGLWDQAVLVYFVACGVSRLARYNVTAEEMAEESGKVRFFEGTPIPTSILLVALVAWLAWTGRTDGSLPGGSLVVASRTLHPLTLLFFLSGSLMISKTLRIPKP